MVLHLAIFLLAVGTNALAQGIPKQVLGKWRVVREVPTSTISCWGETEAKAILRTEIEYTTDKFRWKNIVTSNPRAEVASVTSQQFHDENSGGGINGSQVTFRQLGIKAAKTIQITILHPPADITGATTEIPGDIILVKDKNTILFSVCNLYFEAKRMHTAGR